MTKNNPAPETGDQDVFDLVEAISIEGGDPVPARMGDLEFRIRRNFTGAEVLAVSEAATSGKADIIADILTEGVDPAVLGSFIESHMQNIAAQLWGALFRKAGLAPQGE